MDFGAPINPQGGQAWTEMLQGAIAGAQHPALRTGSMPYEFIVPTFMPDRIAVVSIQGREAVNELYEYDVVVVSPFPPEIIQPAIFGANAWLVMHTPEHDARMVQGVVVALACLGVADRGLGKGLFQYEMTVAPPMWLWTQRERNRVFQDQTVIEVATSMLKADKIHHRFDLDDKEYPKRALYYQRDETDLEFFKRILADAGIYFVFNHAVHDDTTGGVMSDIAMGGAALGVTGGAVSKFAGAAGDRISSVGSAVEEVTKGVTILVLSDDDRGVIPLHDFSAVTELGDQVVKKALGTASQAIAAATNDQVKASAGLDASDPINVDDGYGGPGEELIFDVELRRVVRPKSAWMLERDRGAPQSWAHVQRNDPADAQFDLDVHLRFSEQGVGVDGGAKIKLDVDAPWIPAKTLEKELIQRNSVWKEYPTESRPKKKDRGGVIDTHKHLKHPLEQLRRDAQTATVTTSCRRLGAGYRFNVAQHPSAAFNLELTVLSLTVDAVDPEMLQLDSKDPRTKRPFIATLQCAPADDYAPRPPISARRKFPMELATVIRWQESMDMVTEARNEVYVRLDWDVEREVDRARWFACGNDKAYPLSTNRDGERDRVLRVPVVQPWAGNGYGLQVVPREGMQVLIGYIDSQGDRPVLLGCLHTDKNPPPWGPGYDAKRVGFRTQSAWPNGMMSDRAKAQDIVPPTGWSEISISDAEAEELVCVHAAKDFAVDVVGDYSSVTAGRASESIGKRYTVHVEGGHGVYVGGNRVDTVHGDESRNVHGSRSDSVGGSESHTIGGHLTCRTGGNGVIATLGALSISASGTSRRVDGDSTDVVSGTSQRIVGIPDSNALDTTVVYGTSIVSAKSVVIRAEQSLVLECGTSRIELTPDTLVLAAKALSSIADDIKSRGKTIDISAKDSATLASKEIHASSSGAALDLTDSAQVAGGSIKLKGGGGGSSKDSKKDDDPNSMQVTFKAVGEDGEPLKSCKYHLLASGARYEGTTDGGGVVKEKIPKDTLRCTLRVWPKDYPTGQTKEFDMRIESLPPANTDKGALLRLRNLGYFAGPIPEDASALEAARALAIRAFMSARSDKPSDDGALSSEAVDLLKKMAGH